MNELKPARILAIETSCDETACAVLENGRELLSSTVASQMDIHARYGGVFPEVASRQHVLSIIPVVEQTLVAIESHAEGYRCDRGHTRTRSGGLSGRWNEYGKGTRPRHQPSDDRREPS